MAKLFANSGDPDQTRQNAALELGLHCLPITLLMVSRLQWVNEQVCSIVCSIDNTDILINSFMFLCLHKSGFFQCPLKYLHG